MEPKPRPTPFQFIGKLFLFGLLTLAIMMISAADFLWTTLFFELRHAVRRDGPPPHFWNAGAWLKGKIYWLAGVGLVVLATLVWFMAAP